MFCPKMRCGHIPQFHKIKANLKILLKRQNKTMPCKQHCITITYMTFALYIIMVMEDFSGKWLVVKICSFIVILHWMKRMIAINDCPHIYLDILFINHQNMKYINRLKTFMGTVYVIQTSFV